MSFGFFKKNKVQRSLYCRRFRARLSGEWQTRGGNRSEFGGEFKGVEVAAKIESAASKRAQVSA